MLKLSYNKDLIEAGCDEAGRGCLAGSVFAAAVILPKKLDKRMKWLHSINDSKKISDKARKELRPLIEEYALAYAVASVGREVIDDINILNAALLAMHHAITGLKSVPELLLIDGNRFKPYRIDSGKEIPHKCIIGGDGKYLSIACASILAKTYRDDYMDKLHEQFPNYKWDKNRGYGTKAHREAIIKYGICSFHRMSFTLFAAS